MTRTAPTRMGTLVYVPTKALTSNTATRVAGIAAVKSATVSVTRRVGRDQLPTAATRTPATTRAVPAMRTIVRVARAPAKTRLKRSRPSTSEPNGNTMPGSYGRVATVLNDKVDR